MRDHREHRAACCTTFSLACATTRFVAPWQQQRVVDDLTRGRALLRAKNGLRRRHRVLLRQHRQRDPAVVHHVLQGALPLMHAFGVHCSGRAFDCGSDRLLYRSLLGSRAGCDDRGTWRGRDASAPAFVLQPLGRGAGCAASKS